MAYKTICRKSLLLCDILPLVTLSHPVWCKMLTYNDPPEEDVLLLLGYLQILLGLCV